MRSVYFLGILLATVVCLNLSSFAQCQNVRASHKELLHSIRSFPSISIWMNDAFKTLIELEKQFVNERPSPYCNKQDNGLELCQPSSFAGLNPILFPHCCVFCGAKQGQDRYTVSIWYLEVINATIELQLDVKMWQTNNIQHLSERPRNAFASRLQQLIRIANSKLDTTYDCLLAGRYHFHVEKIEGPKIYTLLTSLTCGEEMRATFPHEGQYLNKWPKAWTRLGITPHVPLRNEHSCQSTKLHHPSKNIEWQQIVVPAREEKIVYRSKLPLHSNYDDLMYDINVA